MSPKLSAVVGREIPTQAANSNAATAGYFRSHSERKKCVKAWKTLPLAIASLAIFATQQAQMLCVALPTPPQNTAFSGEVISPQLAHFRASGHVFVFLLFFSTASKTITVLCGAATTST